jgi:hypothetical protein
MAIPGGIGLTESVSAPLRSSAFSFHIEFEEFPQGTCYFYWI